MKATIIMKGAWFHSYHNCTHIKSLHIKESLDFLILLKVNCLQLHALMTPGKKALENIVGEEENAGNQHFLHSPPKCSLPL